MKISTKYSLLILGLSIVISLFITPLRLLHSKIDLASLLSYGIYLITTLYLIKKYSAYLSSAQIATLIILGASFFQVPIRVLSISSSLGTLPEFGFHLLGIVSGYLFYKLSSLFRWFILTLSLGLCLFYATIGWEFWLHKLNYGTFTGKIKEQQSDTMIFKDYSNNNVKISQYKDKIVVLDFWHSACGICFEKFPEVEKLYNKYKNNPNVQIYAVNWFLKDYDKDGDAFNIIKKNNYSFPVLICKDKPVLETLKITGFPTVVIFDMQGQLVFRGDIESADKIISEQIDMN